MPARAGRTTGTVVCGVSASPGGDSAAELARAVSARLGLRLVLVHVLGRGALRRTGVIHPRVEAERMLERLAGEMQGRAETRVMTGAPAEALAQVAAEEGADLIVLGSRASGLRARNLRSPLAREVEETTSVPVVVAPPATRRRSGHRLGLAFPPGGR